jgi:hypothetical protein
LIAYQRGDYAAAYQQWLPLAQQGDAVAQAGIGGMYLNGLGVTKDDAEALKWLRPAAERSVATAQNNLGSMYANGRGVPRDDAQAVEWFRRSAEQGNAFGQAALGSMYIGGRGVPKDPVLAYMWYSLSIKKQPIPEWVLKGHAKVAAELSPEQIATGEQMARDWKPPTPLRTARPETPAPAWRLWMHTYATPGANPVTIAKPWTQWPVGFGTLDACLAQALVRSNALNQEPLPSSASRRQRVLPDGVILVTYAIRPTTAGVEPNDVFPLLVTYMACKPDAWQSPASPDPQADKREGFQDVIFSFGPAAAGSTLRTIFVESAQLDKHGMTTQEITWCGTDAVCSSRLGAAATLLKQVSPATGSIIYTPGRAPIVTVSLNGSRTTARLILDTGACCTMIKPSLLTAAGIDLSHPAEWRDMSGVTGKVKTPFFPVDLEVAGHRVQTPRVAAFSTNDEGFSDGLLGRDFLDRFKVTIDPAAGTITLVPR